jgi:2-oxoglutarate decarboxylase
MIYPNTAFEEELYFQYIREPESVSPEWRQYFNMKQANNVDLSPENQSKLVLKNTEKSQLSVESNGLELEKLNSVQTKIVENMHSSLEIPTASSVRMIPVKALDENRRIINKYLAKLKRQKVSFTHILAWAIVRALIKYPSLNCSFEQKDGISYRVHKDSINFGLAVDITRKDGSRILMVPNIKSAQNLAFLEFIESFDTILTKTRNNNINPEDLNDTSITLTNPGMIGTTFSNPRLMSGQGLIIACGAIDYPMEFQSVNPSMLTKLAVSKTVTITNTYDHRIIQGAESAEFLSYLHKILIGSEFFYDQIFASLKIPFEPVRWSVDLSKVNKLGETDQFEIIEKGAHVIQLINAFRVRGHLLASVNPLGLSSYYYPELEPSYYGFTIWDLDRIFHADDTWAENNLPLRDIIELMRESYCGNISIEFMHIQDPDKKEWVKHQVETTRFTHEFSRSESIKIFEKIVESEEFENFIHTKFVGSKRFSLEGSESFIVLVNKIFELAADNNLNSVVMGMAHRGRLNALVNLMGKSVEKIFKEFEGYMDPESYQGSGDVKYHLGDRGVFNSVHGNSVNVILASNPSHLELVNPIIEGMARALNNQIHDDSFTKNLPILVHGDAAFAGQGIVQETLNLSQLEGYKTGGTIHIIINNQIGFTTNSLDARSTLYASDVAKMIQVPIIHVNGNDPESVATSAIFAYDFREKFGCDIIIDMLCYRKYGHNESDEPAYTQPLLYKKIKAMSPISKIFASELVNGKIIEKEEINLIVKRKRDSLNEAFVNRSTIKSTKKENQTVKKLFSDEQLNTAVNSETLRMIAEKITQYPTDFKVNPKLQQLLKKRKEMVKSDQSEIDWAMAEALAFGSLLIESKEIRFTGQDCRRGTFSQRHAVFTDIETEDQYISLNHILKNQSKIKIFDSPLSELAVLGFEYGYSVLSGNSLVIWEAQFGDFANMAQAMTDQIIVCAESKWAQTSNLTMLLPHSYDGQGPEHSSARLERFLQLCAEDNIIVGNYTTPANYFHALRRQSLSPMRKPLIIMTPKGMLRHPLAVSSIADLSEGKFQHIIDDSFVNPINVKSITFTTGKIYYELLAKRQSEKIDNVALVRIEQLYPLHTSQIEAILAKYSKAENIIWAQEEPKNMGAWSFISPRLSELIDGKMKIIYIGRKASASTASGSFVIHSAEQKEIIDNVMSYYTK